MVVSNKAIPTYFSNLTKPNNFFLKPHLNNSGQASSTIKLQII